MKTSALLAGLAVLALVMASPSHSYPSSLGPTGILNVPTAAATSPGSFEMMLAYDRPVVAGETIPVFPVATLNYGFNYGEIGVSYFDVNGYTAVKSVHAKVLLAKECEKSPSLAVGVIHMKGDTAETDLYLVASDSMGLMDFFQRHLGVDIKVSGGMLYQKPNQSVHHRALKDNLTGMAGIELGTPGQTTLGLDYIVEDIAAGNTFGAILRQPLSPDLAGQIGVGSGTRYFFGITMKFGGK